MPRSALTSVAFTLEGPRSMPSRSSPRLGTARGVNEPRDALGVDFIPGVAVALGVRSNDAAVGELEVLRDGGRLVPGVQQNRHARIDWLANVGHGLLACAQQSTPRTN